MTEENLTTTTLTVWKNYYFDRFLDPRHFQQSKCIAFEEESDFQVTNKEIQRPESRGQKLGNKNGLFPHRQCGGCKIFQCHTFFSPSPPPPSLLLLRLLPFGPPVL